MSSRTRVVLFGFAAALLFALPLLPEILGTRRLVFRDAQITHWPWRRVAMAAWAQHRVPFVNLSASGGQPMLANPNAVLLYPTVLLERILPAASAFNLHYLLHVLWALFGARLLARRLGLSHGPAFLAGVAYAFSGMILSYGSAFANSAAAAAWLPWCAAASWDVARAGSLPARTRAVAAAALAFGLQLLAGEPAISVLTLVFAGLLGLAATLSAGARRWRETALLAAGGVGAGLGAALLAAPLLLPLAAVLRFTYRGQHLYSERAFGASPFRAWRAIEWLFPRFSGDPGALGAGAHWQYALHPGDLVYIWSVTFGVLPLLLVACAGMSREFWDRRARALALGAAVSLIFACGTALPLFRLLSTVEALRRLRYPIKFYLLTTICMALLVGLAAESWKRRRAGRREWIFLAAVATVYGAAFFAARPGGELEHSVAPLLSGLYASPAALLPSIRATFRGDAVFGFVAIGVIALAIGPRPRAPSEGHWLGLLALLLALPWGLPLFVSADERSLERPPALLSSLTGAGRVYISPTLPELNVLATGTRHPKMPARVASFARVQIEELIPATGSPFGLLYLFDADPDGSYGYYNRLAGEVLSASDPGQTARLLRAFGGRWALEEESERLPSFRPLTGFAIAGRRLVLSEIPDPLPELRWAGRISRRSSLSAALERVRSEGFHADDEVVLPGRTNQDPAAEPDSRAVLSDVRVEPERAAAQVNAAGPGHLLFSRTYFPVWRASLDGNQAPLLVANGRDIAIAVPAGKHRVDFEFDRRPFVRGVSLQAFGAVLILAAAVATRALQKR
jgi:hypothetical protein